MDFYERVKELCKKQDVTVRQLIESVGMNYDSYNGLKRYNNFPRLDEAIKIAEKLNTSVYYLLNGVDYNPDMSDDVKRLVGYYEKMPDPLKKMLLYNANYFSKANENLKVPDDIVNEELDI